MYNLFILQRYCQGTGTIAASLLLLLEEEDAFWMMATIVEDLLPASYYSSTLLGNILLTCNKLCKNIMNLNFKNISQVFKLIKEYFVH